MNITNSSLVAVNELLEVNHILEITAFTILGILTTLCNIIILLSSFDVQNRSICTQICLNLALANTIASAFLSPVNGQGDTWLIEKNMCASYLTVHALWRTLCICLTSFMTIESYTQMYRHYRIVNTEQSNLGNKAEYNNNQVNGNSISHVNDNGISQLNGNNGNGKHRKSKNDINKEEDEFLNKVDNQVNGNSISHVNDNGISQLNGNNGNGKQRKSNNDINKEKDEDKVDNKHCLNLKMILFLIWVSSGVVSFLSFISILQKDSPLCTAYHNIRIELVYLYMIFIIVIPLVTMTVLNFKFWRLSTKYPRTVGVYGNGSHQRGRSLLKDLEFAKCSFKLFQMVLLSWLPHLIYTFCIMSWDIEVIYFDEMAYKMVKTFQWCSYLSAFLQALVMMKKNNQISQIVTREFRNCGKSICSDENEQSLRKDIGENNQYGISPSPGLRRKYILKRVSFHVGSRNSDIQSSSYTFNSSDIPSTSTSAMSGETDL